jgi:hypothetical protein
MKVVGKLTELARRRSNTHPDDSSVTFVFNPDRYMPWSVHSPLLGDKEHEAIGETIEEAAQHALDVLEGES